jgi:alanine dehydrogenase
LSTDPIWIAESDAVSVIDMAQAIDALERGLRLEAAGHALNMIKTHAAWDGSTLHAIGAVFPDDGLACTKTWAHTEKGATPLVMLFDSRNGSLLAIIEAFALGQLRTGGISGLATRYMAAPDAAELALIGAGKQALTQLAAVNAVRRLRKVRVFSRSSEKANTFATRARAELDLDVVVFDSIDRAVDGAPVITLVTRAKEPFLFPTMIARGAHINAIGAIAPERIEFAPELLDRCDMVVADSIDQTRSLSREFIDYYGNDTEAWKKVTPLSAIIAENYHRPAQSDLTLFKAMGMGISDLSLAVEIYRRATESGLGVRIPHPKRAAPRLRPAS